MFVGIRKFELLPPRKLFCFRSSVTQSTSSFFIFRSFGDCSIFSHYFSTASDDQKEEKQTSFLPKKLLKKLEAAQRELWHLRQKNKREVAVHHSINILISLN
jgi:hypothetical protein